MSSVRIISWDWRGQPDIERLNEAVNAVFDGIHCSQIVEIDTGGDEYTAVISSGPLSSEESQAAYEAWLQEETA